jgi:hypothetical protein
MVTCSRSSLTHMAAAASPGKNETLLLLVARSELRTYVAQQLQWVAGLRATVHQRLGFPQVQEESRAVDHGAPCMADRRAAAAASSGVLACRPVRLLVRGHIRRTLAASSLRLAPITEKGSGAYLGDGNDSRPLAAARSSAAPAPRPRPLRPRPAGHETTPHPGTRAADRMSGIGQYVPVEVVPRDRVPQKRPVIIKVEVVSEVAIGSLVPSWRSTRSATYRDSFLLMSQFTTRNSDRRE